MQEGSKKALKIVLWIILGAVYFTSLYFSYLYLAQVKEKSTMPEEIQKTLIAERKGYFGTVIDISKENIKIKESETGQEIEMKISGTTTYTKYIISKNERSDVKIEDFKSGMQVNVVAWQNPDDGSYNADNIEFMVEE